jgi:hypothetical protein
MIAPWNSELFNVKRKVQYETTGTLIPSLPVGMQNGPVTLEDSLLVSYKIVRSIAIQFSICTPWYLPK